MKATISPSTIAGTVQAPASKSSMQRACAVALISGGTTVISHAGNSNDEQAALGIIQSLGAEVEAVKNQLIVKSRYDIFHAKDTSKHTLVSCGESGLSLRMFVPVAALCNHDVTFNGEGSILARPINFFDEVLPKLRVSVNSNNGRLPITVRGPLNPVTITVDGSLSSQFLTGLIIAYAKACTQPVTINVTNLKSKPYIDLTLKVLEQFGYKIVNNHFEEFTIYPRKALAASFTTNYSVEGDWSNAAFLLVAGAIGGEVTLKGMDMRSTQGDRKIINALESAGADVMVGWNEITVRKAELSGFSFNATHCPDLFPPLVSLASYCKGITTITGVERLRFKESNRGITLQKEFAKMNVKIELKGDVMIIRNDLKVNGAAVSSHNDHRIAMATAVAGLGARGTTEIDEAEAVNKSYPGFYKDLQKLNASIQTA